jgi:hypothetical protein
MKFFALSSIRNYASSHIDVDIKNSLTYVQPEVIVALTRRNEVVMKYTAFKNYCWRFACTRLPPLAPITAPVPCVQANLHSQLMYVFLLTLICSCSDFLAANESAALRTLLVHDSTPTIALTTRSDVKKIDTVFHFIAKKTKLQFISHTISRNQFSKNALQNWLNSSKKSTNDVVIVYYVGTGTNCPLQNDRWPLIIGQNNVLISEREIVATVKNHAPRMALVVFDCYNRAATLKDKIYRWKFQKANSLRQKNQPGLKTLFRKTSGIITACSGFPVDSCLYLNRSSQRGGFFTNSLLLTLCTHSKFKAANWGKIRILSSGNLSDYNVTESIFEDQSNDHSHLPTIRRKCDN